jgi:hypothetical protein
MKSIDMRTENYSIAKKSSKSSVLRTFAITLLALLCQVAWAKAAEKRQTTVNALAVADASDDASDKAKERKDKAEAGSDEKDSSKKVGWMGVVTEEASETLSVQLGLKAGEGVVVTYVAPDSPAAKAGLKRHDVLAEFDSQLLVHPSQLRKLVRMHKEGDTVKVSFYHNGTKQTVEITLAQTTSRRADSFLENHKVLGDLPKIDPELQLHISEDVQKTIHEALARAGVDKERIRTEIKRSLEEARVAVQEAMRNMPKQHDMDRLAKELHEMAHSAV